MRYFMVIVKRIVLAVGTPERFAVLSSGGARTREFLLAYCVGGVKSQIRNFRFQIWHLEF